MFDLDQTIKERHSTRMFLPEQPVPRELVSEALALAVHAPSNSNIQAWHMVFASGALRDRLVAGLLDEAGDARPISHPCQSRSRTFAEIWVFKSTGRWESFARTRRAGGLRSCATGSSSARHRLAYLHAWDLGSADALSVGILLQTLLLALTARGLGDC